MNINNKDLIQSYVLTTAKYDFTIYEKRVLYRLVEMCQFAIEGKTLGKGFSYEQSLFEGLYNITLPIHAFLSDGEDRNTLEVKKALKSLRNKTIEYEYQDPNKGKVWKLIGLIELPKYVYRGYVTFKIHPEIHEAILNFSKGYSRYELETAMSFKSRYAMRFYELLSGQKAPITYSISQLRIMFKLEDKYKNNGDFIKRTIDKSKEELDEKSPYSFEYKKNTLGKQVVSITFYPVYNAKNRDPDLEKRDLQKKASLSWDLDRMVVNYLKENFGFSDKEIKNNIDLLKVASKEMDIMWLLSELRVVSPNKKNPKGYTIGAIKSALDQKTK
jgi:plasmid replication initiation protein